MLSTTYRLARTDREEQLSLALAQQIGEIQVAAQIAHLGMAQIAQAHQYASRIGAETLALVEQIVQEADQTDRLTPFEQAALQHLRVAYLLEMLAAAEETGNQIIQVVARSGG